MAVRAICGNCKKTFSAPDEYLGNKIRCPSCQTKIKIITEGERVEMAEQEQLDKNWKDEQLDRIRLIETMSGKKEYSSDGMKSYSVAFGTGVEKVRNFHAGATTRFRKLRAVSRFLLLAAYLSAALVMCGAALTVALYSQGIIEQPLILALCLVGWAILFVACFFSFKFFGESSWLMADLGDHQLDVRNIVLDMREDYDREQRLNSQSKIAQATMMSTQPSARAN